MTRLGLDPRTLSVLTIRDNQLHHPADLLYFCIHILIYKGSPIYVIRELFPTAIGACSALPYATHVSQKSWLSITLLCRRLDLNNHS